MQDLQDLIEFIQKTKFKSNSLLEALIRPDSQLGKIYHALAENAACTDQEILSRYPEMKSVQHIGVLKARLKNRLCDAVFLLDFREESYPDRQLAFVECVKKWSAAMILISKNIRSIGVRQLEKILRTTLDFEFTELSINIIRTLELYYGTIEGDQKKYTELENLLAEQEAVWLAERQVERWYSDLVINYVNSRADKHLIAGKAEEYYQQAQAYMSRYRAFKIHFFGYLIRTIIHDSKSDYAAMADTCTEAIAFFAQKNYNSGMVLQTFYYNLISCCLYSREFQRGQPYVHMLEQLLEENSFNWFKVQELYFLMAMHTGNFQVAREILEKVQVNAYLQVQPPHILETWKVFEAYVYFLALTNQLPESALAVQTLDFKINRFLNEVPLLAKDKRGMNVPVLIVQFLIYLAQYRFADCEARIDALHKYCTRYLNDEATARSRNFIKMLLQIPPIRFSIDQLRAKTAKALLALKQLSGDAGKPTLEVEMIPYEALWEIILQHFEQRPPADRSQALLLVRRQEKRSGIEAHR